MRPVILPHHLVLQSSDKEITKQIQFSFELDSLLDSLIYFRVYIKILPRFKIISFRFKILYQDVIAYYINTAQIKRLISF